MEFLQDVGTWLLVALCIVLAAFLLVEMVGDALGFLLGWLLRPKPQNPAEWRSTGKVRRAFERDPETGDLKGKITAQGEIWSAVWVDDSTPPPEVGAEVAIVRTEGLVAHVGSVPTSSE